MDTTQPQTPQPNSVSSHPAFPSITEQFIETWQVTNANVIHLLILGVVSVLLFLGFFGIMALIGVFGGFGLGIFSQLSRGVQSITPFMIFAIVTYVVVAVAGLVIISTVVNAALVLILADYPNKNLGVSTALKHGMRLVVPLFIVGILTFFLTTGSFFLFVFPGIAVAFLLSFVSYEVILKDRKPIEALSTSVAVFSQHVGEIISRIIVFYLLNFAIVYLVPGLFSQTANSELKMSIALLSFLIRLYMGWFGMVYGLVLYREASARTDYSKKPSVLWMYVTAIIGWVIAIGIVFAVINVIATNQNKIVPAIQQEFQKEVEKKAKTNTNFNYNYTQSYPNSK